jgi:hypothetical protein
MYEFSGLEGWAHKAFVATLVLGVIAWAVVIGLVLHQFLI